MSVDWNTSLKASLRADADEVICALTPDPFLSCGRLVPGFDQTTDDEVRDLIKKRMKARSPHLEMDAT